MSNIIPICINENLGKYRAVSLTAFLGEVVEQVFMEVFSKNVKDKKENGGENPAQIYQGWIVLYQHHAFCDETTYSVDERRVTDALYLDFKKALDMFVPAIPVDKLVRYNLDIWTVKGVSSLEIKGQCDVTGSKSNY